MVPTPGFDEAKGAGQSWGLTKAQRGRGKARHDRRSSDKVVIMTAGGKVGTPAGRAVIGELIPAEIGGEPPAIVLALPAEGAGTQIGWGGDEIM